MPLTASQQAIVKSTAPVLKEHGTTITSLFYKNMIGAHPELRNVFNLSNQRNGDQPKALAASVLAYASHIDDLGALGGAVERIAQRHVSLRVTADQYPIVGKHLMEAIATVLGPALTPEIADAWTAAYQQLANIFIAREDEMYKDAGEWAGWRKFRIEKREKESTAVESFYLVPEDGEPLPSFQPGQYVSLRVRVPQLDNIWQCRQYSLSEAPSSDHWRISVKKEAKKEDDPGVVSNLLHDNYKVGDVVEMSFPRGEFSVDIKDPTKADVPIVLLSAGVGVTPEMSILEGILSSDSQTKTRPVRWIHAAKDGEELPFAKQVRSIAAERDTVDTVFFLSQVKTEEEKGRDFDFQGRMDLDVLDQDKHLFIQDPKTEYFMCGPQTWMLETRAKLEQLGVSQDRVRLELFGTGNPDHQ